MLAGCLVSFSSGFNQTMLDFSTLLPIAISPTLLLRVAKIQIAQTSQTTSTATVLLVGMLNTFARRLMGLRVE